MRPLEGFRSAVEGVMPPAWRCLQRFGVQPDEVDDALQNVLLILFRNWDRLKDAAPSELRAYACCASVGVARDLARSRARSRRHLRGAPIDQDLEGEAHGGSPEAHAERREAIAMLDAALQRMPDDLREVFVLHVIEQLSKRELASHLGIPEGTAASRIRRAREDFSRIVAEMRLAAKGGSS